MKRFSKMLALGMALAFVFGMTVSAANSPVAGSIDATATAQTGSAGATVTAPADDVVNTVVSATAKAAPTNLAVKKVVGVWDITVTSPGTVSFALPAPGEGKRYVLFHFEDDGTTLKEVIELGYGNGLYYAYLTSGSPYAMVLVEDNGTGTPSGSSTANGTNNTASPVSPKTGETVPMTGILAVICLAGAAVCVKKARCNG